MRTVNLILILIGWLWLSYLIYRYRRYSDWRQTIIGKSFMMMKQALWVLFTFILLARLFPDWEGRQYVSTVLLAYCVAAIIRQTLAVVSLQGGFRRREVRTSGTEDGSGALASRGDQST